LPSMVSAVQIGIALARYDPLAVDLRFTARTLELVVLDSKRDREIPLLIYMPATTAPAPVVLFSHGLGSLRTSNAFLGEHWAARGYVAAFLQHPGSDTSVWRDLPVAKRMEAMRRAASPQNFMRRAQDLQAVLDALTSWNSQSQHPLAGRLD